MKSLSVEMACLLDIQNEMQAVWYPRILYGMHSSVQMFKISATYMLLLNIYLLYSTSQRDSTCRLFAPGVCLEEKDIKFFL